MLKTLVFQIILLSCLLQLEATVWCSSPLSGKWLAAGQGSRSLNKESGCKILLPIISSSVHCKQTSQQPQSGWLLWLICSPDWYFEISDLSQTICLQPPCEVSTLFDPFWCGESFHLTCWPGGKVLGFSLFHLTAACNLFASNKYFPLEPPSPTHQPLLQLLS